MGRHRRFNTDLRQSRGSVGALAPPVPTARSMMRKSSAATGGFRDRSTASREQGCTIFVGTALRPPQDLGFLRERLAFAASRARSQECDVKRSFQRTDFKPCRQSMRTSDTTFDGSTTPACQRRCGQSWPGSSARDGRDASRPCPVAVAEPGGRIICLLSVACRKGLPNTEHGGVVRLLRNGEAKVPAHVEHRFVLTQHHPGQLDDANLSRDFHQPGQ